MKCLPLVRILMRTAYGMTRVYRFFLRPVNVAVKVMFIRNGQVLLVRHTYRPLLYLPGGSVKRGETLEEAARREAYEEVGAKIQRLALFGVYSGIRGIDNDHIAVFLADGFDLEESANLEIEQINFYDLKDLPVDISPSTARRLAEYAANPSRGSHFGKW